MPDDGRSISRNVALLTILVYETCCVINTEQTSEYICKYSKIPGSYYNVTLTEGCD